IACPDGRARSPRLAGKGPITSGLALERHGLQQFSTHRVCWHPKEFLAMPPSSASLSLLEGASLALAALSYVLIVRLAVDLTLGALGNNLAVRALRWVTNPVVRGVGAITPRVVPLPLVTGCALLWIFAARIALVQVGAAIALRRMTG
ncbi:MAG: hypothetical protein J2P51_13030, partial [Hyphomicrobiaceae bacterium]|nr:hypothetical protein [Hyphomicrobiaceae bacterium]